jgi:hypothetical protein
MEAAASNRIQRRLLGGGKIRRFCEIRVSISESVVCVTLVEVGVERDSMEDESTASELPGSKEERSDRNNDIEDIDLTDVYKCSSHL